MNFLRHVGVFGFWMALCLSGPGCGELQAQIIYEEDGAPPPLEEEIRWLLNRARFSRAKENALRGTNYSDVPATCGPLAPNFRLTRSSRNHCEDMARKNLFQHKTVPGSLFYNPGTQTNPWDRMSAEGYVWNQAAENIAAGFTSAVGVYVGWWKSTGHRVNMINENVSEIGVGYHFRASSEYVEYYGMNLGRSGLNSFFTGTLFEDTNGNRTYTQGEGRGGVKVELLVGGIPHAFYDVSTGVGSFAVPMDGIAPGAVVKVVLSNTTAVPMVVSVPRNYDSLETVAMKAGESWLWGQFTRDSEERNQGFRDAAPPTSYLTLVPGEGAHSSGAGTGSFAVGGDGAWTAQGTAPWLRVTGGQSGSGSGTVSYELDANTSGDSREGSLMVSGVHQLMRTFKVIQAGVPAVLDVESSLLLVEAAGVGLLDIEVNANVTWTATESVHWIQFEGASSRTGSGFVKLAVAPNISSLARETVLKISGGGLVRDVTIQQQAGVARRVAEDFQLDVTEGGGVLAKVTGLPPGLVWNKVSGRIEGRPTQGGSYVLKVDVRDDFGVITRREITLIISPLPGSAVGTFVAKLARSEALGAGLGGDLRMQVTATGAATGTLRLAGKAHSWTGRVTQATGQDPEVDATVSRSQSGNILLRVQLLPENDIAGTATVAGQPVPLEGWRRVWSSETANVPEGMRGRMNVVMDLREEWQNDTALPQGAGFAALTVSRNGSTVWSGRTGDGALFTRSGWLGPEGQSGFWHSLYGAQGSVMATVTCTSDGWLSGSGCWVKKGASTIQDRAYREGLGQDSRGPIGLALYGEKWIVPAAGRVLLDEFGQSNGTNLFCLSLMLGVMDDTATPNPVMNVTLTPGNRLVVPAPGSAENPTRLQIQVAATTGRIWGDFELKDPNPGGGSVRRTVYFHGMLLPRSLLAAGYFRGSKLTDTGALPGLNQGEITSGLLRMGVHPAP